MEIIGRISEQKKLTTLCNSKKSEFLAVIGRRRVGKTYLIRAFFQSCFTFNHTGLANANTEQQLENFHNSLIRQANNYNSPVPSNWLQALQHLIDYIESQKGPDKKVIFLDELPWLDTPRSDFMTAFEHLWNGYLSARSDIILIACGSAASWMINELIKNTGGLYNRVTARMHIMPFNLSETETFLQYKNVQLTRYQILQLYMVVGGIPFYLDEIQPGMSAAQNIEAIAFSKHGLLRNEYSLLLNSLFRNAESHKTILATLAKKTIGLTRKQIVEETKFSSGGGLSKLLDELEESGFIATYQPFENKKKETLYRLSDYYTMFYYKFLSDNRNYEEGYWINAIDLPSHRVWGGFSFEQICLDHVAQIKKALGISGVQSQSSSWIGEHAQIDLLIDRRDQVITICEAKFSINQYSITSDYAKNLRNKIGSLRAESKTKKAIHLALITTFGVCNLIKYGHLVQNSITMEDLFAPL